MNPLILFLLGAPQQRVAAIFSRTLLPNLIGGPVLAALVQDRELRRQEETDKTIIQEVVNDFAVKKEQLPKHKALNQLYTSLPEALQTSITFPTG
jgi:hypothetical protein